MKKETDLETFAKVLTGKENLMYDYEKSLTDRAKNLEYKEKQYGVQVGHTGTENFSEIDFFGSKIQNFQNSVPLSQNKVHFYNWLVWIKNPKSKKYLNGILWIKNLFFFVFKL